jgi:hypothetical protein
LTASATAALAACLIAWDISGSVLAPAFTFPATFAGRSQMKQTRSSRSLCSSQISNEGLFRVLVATQGALVQADELVSIQ